MYPNGFADDPIASHSAQFGLGRPVDLPAARPVWVHGERHWCAVDGSARRGGRKPPRVALSGTAASPALVTVAAWCVGWRCPENGTR
jgi:hypothetical protein